jgi:hypothetical protein
MRGPRGQTRSRKVHLNATRNYLNVGGCRDLDSDSDSDQLSGRHCHSVQGMIIPCQVAGGLVLSLHFVVRRGTRPQISVYPWGRGICYRTFSTTKYSRWMIRRPRHPNEGDGQNTLWLNRCPPTGPRVEVLSRPTSWYTTMAGAPNWGQHYL